MLRLYGKLVTTEKDWINLGGDGPEGVYWLKIRVEMEEEEEFLRLIKERASRGIA
jgi:tetraacyldisaccharide-1-P 4'-kinase